MREGVVQKRVCHIGVDQFNWLQRTATRSNRSKRTLTASLSSKPWAGKAKRATCAATKTAAFAFKASAIHVIRFGHSCAAIAFTRAVSITTSSETKTSIVEN